MCEPRSEHLGATWVSGCERNPTVRWVVLSTQVCVVSDGCKPLVKIGVSVSRPPLPEALLLPGLRTDRVVTVAPSPEQHVERRVFTRKDSPERHSLMPVTSP